MENSGEATVEVDVRSSIQWRAPQCRHSTLKGLSLCRGDNEVGVTGDNGCNASGADNEVVGVTGDNGCNASGTVSCAMVIRRAGVAIRVSISHSRRCLCERALRSEVDTSWSNCVSARRLACLALLATRRATLGNNE
jgi:hypothetical protein